MGVACHRITTITSVSARFTPGPPPGRELPDPAASHRDAFSAQQFALQLHAAPEAADLPTGCNYTMAWDACRFALSHDVAHGSAGARASGCCRDVAVGGHTAWR